MSLESRISALITAIGADIKDLRNKTGPWTAVTFAGTWGNQGAGEDACQYRVIDDGLKFCCEFRGVAKSNGRWDLGAATANICQIPAPPTGRTYAMQRFLAMGRDTNAGTQYVFQVQSGVNAGFLTITRSVPDGLSGSNNALVSLHGIRVFVI